MFQEFLIKLSKKNKIIIVLFIGSIFLIFFTLSKKNKKQYYQNKIEKLQQLNQNTYGIQKHPQNKIKQN